MNKHGRRPPPSLDRRARELLLRRDPAARHLSPRLAEVLAAAAAPARTDELAGRAAAVEAFRAARNAAKPTRSNPVRSWLARLLTVKAMLALFAATGGVTLAAATGGLPGSSESPVSPPPSVSSGPTSSPAGAVATGSPRITASATATGAPVHSCSAVPRPTGNIVAPFPRPGEVPVRPGRPQPHLQRGDKTVRCGGAGPTVVRLPTPSAAASFSGSSSAPIIPGRVGECRDRCRPPETAGSPPSAR